VEVKVKYGDRTVLTIPALSVGQESAVSEVLDEIHRDPSVAQRISAINQRGCTACFRLLCQGICLIPTKKFSDDGNRYFQMLELHRVLTVKVFDNSRMTEQRRPIDVNFENSDLTADDVSFLEYVRQTNRSLLNESLGNDECFEETDLYRYAHGLDPLRITSTSQGAVPSASRDIAKCVEMFHRFRNTKQLCEDREKRFADAILTLQKNAFSHGEVRDVIPRFAGGGASEYCGTEKPKRNHTDPPYEWKLHHKLHDMLMFGSAALHLGGQVTHHLTSLPSIRFDERIDRYVPDRDVSYPPECFLPGASPNCLISSTEQAAATASSQLYFNLEHILTCWRKAASSEHNQTKGLSGKSAKGLSVKPVPLIEHGVVDLVAFHDMLSEIEERRQQNGKPAKLQFWMSDTDKRTLSLHRVVGFGFDGKIGVRCAPMPERIREQYRVKMQEIQQERDKNSKLLKDIKSGLGVVCLFLLTLARGKMHRIAAFEESFGIVNINRSLVTESVLKEEMNAYADLGLFKPGLLERETFSSEDFRKLSEPARSQLDKGQIDWILRPFKNLKKLQHHSEDLRLPRPPADDETVSVATVISCDLALPPQHLTYV
jgi:hypothetical protein